MTSSHTQPDVQPQASASGSGVGSTSNATATPTVYMDVDDYSVPKPSKIKLKETQQERAQRIFDQEIRRQKRKENLISRANGYALSPSPPPRGRPESITPPRIPVPKHHDQPGSSASVSGMMDREEERARMEWMEAEELDRLESDPFRSYTMPDVHIPKRFRPASPPHHSSYSSSFSPTSTYRPGHIPNANGTGTNGIGIGINGGRIPSMNGMNDDEYTQFIRDGMERLRNITDQHHREELKRQREKAAEERLRREEADQKRREERRKRRKANTTQPQPQQSQSQPRHYVNVEEDTDTVVDLVRDSKALERARYINIWQSLIGVGAQGEIQQVEMRYKDIPWPIYGGKQLDKSNIYNFLSDLATDTTGTGTGTTVNKSSSTSSSSSSTSVKDREKKVLRDAIRIFHPDRFFGRFLERVRVSDRDKVKEGVEVCSRVINALAAENAAR